jgi:hypothetical protein
MKIKWSHRRILFAAVLLLIASSALAFHSYTYVYSWCGLRQQYNTRSALNAGT